MSFIADELLLFCFTKDLMMSLSPSKAAPDADAMAVSNLFSVAGKTVIVTVSTTVLVPSKCGHATIDALTSCRTACALYRAEVAASA